MNNNNNEMKSNVFSDYTNSNNNENNNVIPNNTNINQGVSQIPQTNNTQVNGTTQVNNASANNQTVNNQIPNNQVPNNQITNTTTTSSIMGTSASNKTTNTYFQNIPNVPINNQSEQNTNQPNQIPVNQDIAMPKLNSDKTVGTMKKDTQKSPVAMLILFACLIIGIFLIPYITPYLNNVLKIFGIDDNSSIYGDGKYDDSSDTNTKDNDTNKDNNSNTDTKVTTYYDILDTTSITFNKLTITNLTKTEENGNFYLNYKITNIDTDTLNSKEEITLKSILNNNEYKTATKLEVLERTTADYQSITLKNNKLTCTGNNHSTIYTFTSNKLTGIDDTYNYTFIVNDEAYASYALNVQNTVNDLNKITGISAGFVNTQTGFTKTTKINYSETSENLTKYDRIYYEKDIAASTVKYELESIGYKCD